MKTGEVFREVAAVWPGEAAKGFRQRCRIKRPERAGRAGVGRPG